jgi:hypothetical protein
MAEHLVEMPVIDGFIDKSLKLSELVVIADEPHLVEGVRRSSTSTT